MEVESLIFKMPGKRFALELIRLYAMRWIYLSSGILIFAILAGIIIDIRWLLIGLMLAFTVFPIFLALLYFYHGLKPKSVVNVINHKYEFRDDRIVATAFTSFTDNDKDDEVTQNSYLQEIKYNDISDFNVGLSSVTIPLRKGKDGFIWLPISAFATESDFSHAISIIVNNNK